MEQAEQLPTGGEYSGDASASASGDFVESPPLPFPDRFPAFSRNYSDRERFPRTDNEGYLTNNQGSPVIREDSKSCCIASATFSAFAMTMAFGLFAPETLRLGPNASILINPNHLFVESVKVEALNAVKGSMMYGFYKNPPLDVTATWSETHKIVLPASTHKEWIYYLNKGSQINISYSVNSLSSSSLLLIIAEGESGLAEWLKDPSYANINLSWNKIHGNGSTQTDISESSAYYVAVGNLNAEFAGVHLNTTIKASLYNTTESYYKCTPAEGQCTFKLFPSGGNAAVLTSLGRLPGMAGGDCYVKVSYGCRWVTYMFGAGGVTSLLLLINYFSNHLRRTDQDTTRDQPGDIGSERHSLLSHKDDNTPSRGSSCASISDDEDYVKDPHARVEQGQETVKDEEYRRHLCAICFDAPKECFFLPCGHSVACFECATRIVETSGTCPICRRHTKKVRKIYTV